jgi:hypothetical protein
VTTFPRTRIICDRQGPGCSGHGDFADGPRKARVAARMTGWYFSQHPKLDVCPGCQSGGTR